MLGKNNSVSATDLTYIIGNSNTFIGSAGLIFGKDNYLT